MEPLERPPLFTAAWARALQSELASSEEFRRAAAGWQGRLVLESAAAVGGEAAGAAVSLYLDDGVCREAGAASAEDRELAAFVIAGRAEVWQGLLDGQASPLTALLRGQLRLVKGSVAGLMPFASAAEQLVRAAGRVSVAPAAPPPPPPPAAEPVTVEFRSMRPDGIDFDSPPMQLWQKAKQFGIWDPQAIDLSADRRDWLELAEPERDVLLRLAALFGAGEESVTRELLPLIRVIAREGRLEEEMFLAAFLWEEAKHVEAFRLFFDRVAADASDLSRFHTPSYRKIFYEELPAAMGRLDEDPSAIALARASATYNMIVEGVLAETGYHVYHSILEGRGIMPGMQEIVRNLQRDESRHLAYGVHLLSRLVAEHGEPVWRAIERRMDELLQPAVAVVEEIFALYEEPPFGLQSAVFVDFALDQFRRRLERIERARG